MLWGGVTFETMTDKEIIEGNKLIAGFLQLQYHKVNQRKWISQSFDDYGSTALNGYWMEKGEYYFYNSEQCSESQLKFHSSWDWLMPVLDKIQAQVYGVNIVNNYCQIIVLNKNNTYKYAKTVTESKSKIENAWQSAVEFITWHNKQNQSNP